MDSIPKLHTRPEWSPQSPTEALELIDRSVIGILVTSGPGGLAVSHLPFLLARARGRNGTLVSHVATVNDHAPLIEGARPAWRFFGQSTDTSHHRGIRQIPSETVRRPGTSPLFIATGDLTP
jgi:hypothetical protein